MPIYARKCVEPACGHAFETFARMGEPIVCERCGAATDTDFAAQKPPAVPAMTLTGSRTRCLQIACAPKEVRTLRRMYGQDGAGHCWQDDGRVKFDSESDAKRFFRKDEEIRARFAEKKAASAQASQNGLSAP